MNNHNLRSFVDEIGFVKGKVLTPASPVDPVSANPTAIPLVQTGGGQAEAAATTTPTSDGPAVHTCIVTILTVYTVGFVL
ncbi:hypothetical protein RvY_11153 [Ramazzottius varieornatus]|uniref:Uncharacterized protein n=1 Tax=Ramazzottius varieornatus TaxID=947166 RepID=A0A1D1VP25_RAMVA|nr:hypothetical protein RvY_11153 [Ramazzottius varieornatus]